MENVLAMQGVVGHRAAYLFSDLQPIRVVEEGDSSVGLGHLPELTALVLSVHLGAIIDKIANGILFLKNCAEIIHTFRLNTLLLRCRQSAYTAKLPSSAVH